MASFSPHQTARTLCSRRPSPCSSGAHASTSASPVQASMIPLCPSSCLDAHGSHRRGGWSSDGARRGAVRAAASPVDHAASVMATQAFVSPMCFSQECQAAADQAFLIAVSIPLVVAAAAIAYILRPVPQELKETGRVFEDPTTGTIFEAPEGVVPERDKAGALVFKAMSYTPWPVGPETKGERLRIDVGPVGSCQPTSYVFEPLLRPAGASRLLTVRLPRPLGVVLQYDEERKRAVVSELVPGSVAEQRLKLAGLNTARASDAVLPGDILRAVTCTNIVYPTSALLGAGLPQRHIVLYGADKQTWRAVVGALRKGEAKDGDVTLVLERRRVDDDS